MALNIPGLNNIFPHSKEFDQGGGKERPGQATAIVSTDGTSDFSDIQEAHDALPSEGGMIFIKEGTYIQGLTIRKSNVHIVGTGKGTTITGTMTSDGNNGILIKNLNFNPGGAATVVKIHSGNNCSVIQCWFSVGASAIDRCIELWKADEIIISNNYMNPNGDGIIIGEGCNSILINNNSFKGGGASDFRAIELIPEDTENATDIVIANNIIDDYSVAGIELDEAAPDLKHIIITGNRITNCAVGVIINAGIDNALLLGNILEGNTTAYTDAGTNTQIGHNITT